MLAVTVEELVDQHSYPILTSYQSAELSEVHAHQAPASSVTSYLQHAVKQYMYYILFITNNHGN